MWSQPTSFSTPRLHTGQRTYLTITGGTSTWTFTSPVMYVGINVITVTNSYRQSLYSKDKSDWGVHYEAHRCWRSSPDFLAFEPATRPDYREIVPGQQFIYRTRKKTFALQFSPRITIPRSALSRSLRGKRETATYINRLRT